MTENGGAPTQIDAHKAELRARARARREALAPGARADAGSALCARLWGMLSDGVFPVTEGQGVAGYWPMGSEVDLRALYERLVRRGHLLALVRVRAQGMPLEFRRWQPGDPLRRGPYGTFHPCDAAPVVVPRLVLTPLLAFDREGRRLGYGGGYYDRTLEKLRQTGDTTAVGVAFSAQEVAHVPTDRRDQTLDWIVTEKEAIRTS